MSVRQPYPVSDGGDVSSVSNTGGTLTISPTTGAVVASIALGNPNTWTGQQIFTVSPPSAPGSGSSSERFGASSVASSTNSMAIGNGATSTTGVGNIAIGQGASATGNSAMAVGYLSEASNTLSFAFGPSATASGLSSVAIGSPATVSGNGSVGIVSNVNVANTFGCGNASYPITDVFFGQGRVGSAFGYAQVDYAVNGSGGAGTDATGGHLIIAGGKATGNAVGGSILFKTSDAGASGTTLQSLTTKMTLNEVGNVGIGTVTPNQLLTIEGTLSLKEQAAANADTAAYGQLWVKSDTPNTLWFTDDAGNDAQLESSRFFGGSFTRDMSTASGTQAITGVGFKPKAVIQINVGTTGGNDQASTGGTMDGTNNGCIELGVVSNHFPQTTFAGIWRVDEAGGNYQTFVLSSFDSDGFTITWTKTGTPTGTATVTYLAVR